MRNRIPAQHPVTDPLIGIDATYSVGQNLSGVGQYSLHLIAALSGRQRLRLYYRPHRFLRAPWPKRLLLDTWPPTVDVFHGLNQRLPLNTRCPSVTTFHDLFVLSAEYSTPDFRQRFAGQASAAAERSDRIIAVSQFTADQVVNYLGYPREQIRVVPHGVELPESIPSTESRKPIVLCVGAIQKRKNTQRLIQAFGAMPANWELWIAGARGFAAEAMLADLPPNVRLLGYVSDQKLSQLYREASIFAFPSLDEGFGMPILEAMAHGLPVLTSTTSALPEVAGDAAILVNPIETDAIANGLERMLDPELRSRMAQRGLARVKEFSWANTASMTAAVYKELCR